jgi:hypothetical protein
MTATTDGSTARTMSGMCPNVSASPPDPPATVVAVASGADGDEPDESELDESELHAERVRTAAKTRADHRRTILTCRVFPPRPR